MTDKIHIETLKKAGNITWTDQALIAGSTYYSEPIPVYYLKGYASLLVKATDSITITFEVSADRQNWYIPYDPDGTALNSIVSALTSDRWISFAPQIAGYIRLKVVCNSNSTTSMTLIQMKADIKI